MESIQKLTEYFLRFPGIGPRQARRFTYFLLRQDKRWIDDFMKELAAVYKESRVCIDCRRHFIGGNTRCPTCADTGRSPERLMVVEKEVDFESIEKSRAYNGYYYILGGTISPLETTESAPAVSALGKRIEAMPNLTEVVLALSATTEGDDTAEYLMEALAPAAKTKGFSVSVLGRGLSTGSEIEYADSQTLKDAFARRTPLKGE